MKKKTGLLLVIVIMFTSCRTIENKVPDNIVNNDLIIGPDGVRYEPYQYQNKTKYSTISSKNKYRLIKKINTQNKYVNK
jgi:hypothetical protein